MFHISNKTVAVEETTTDEAAAAVWFRTCADTSYPVGVKIETYPSMNVHPVITVVCFKLGTNWQYVRAWYQDCWGDYVQAPVVRQRWYTSDDIRLACMLTPR